MYRQRIAKKTSPFLPTTPINKKTIPTPSYAPLSVTIQRAVANPESLSRDEWLQLDSAIGTRATNEIKSGKRTSWEPEFKGISAQWMEETGQNIAPVQAKLTIGEVGDKYEQEADRVAAEVVKNVNVPKAPEFKGISAQWMEETGQNIAPVQAKLTIGEVGDKYEQEADRVAAEVVQQINRPAPVSNAQGEVLQGKESKEEEGELQLKPMVQGRADAGGEASTELESAINSARVGGKPLDAGLQQSMGQAMGADFSGVRVHTDTQSDRLNQSLQAKAFTTGQDVFFRQGAYEPGSREGQELIAHEMVHVEQQRGVVPRQQETKIIQRVLTVKGKQEKQIKIEEEDLIKDEKWKKLKQELQELNLEEKKWEKIRQVLFVMVKKDEQKLDQTIAELLCNIALDLNTDEYTSYLNQYQQYLVSAQGEKTLTINNQQYEQTSESIGGSSQTIGTLLKPVSLNPNLKSSSKQKQDSKKKNPFSDFIEANPSLKQVSSKKKKSTKKKGSWRKLKWQSQFKTFYEVVGTGRCLALFNKCQDQNRNKEQATNEYKMLSEIKQWTLPVPNPTLTLIKLVKNNVPVWAIEMDKVEGVFVDFHKEQFNSVLKTVLCAAAGEELDMSEAACSWNKQRTGKGTKRNEEQIKDFAYNLYNDLSRIKLCGILFVITDLQGIVKKDGHFVIIDPQWVGSPEDLTTDKTATEEAYEKVNIVCETMWLVSDKGSQKIKELLFPLDQKTQNKFSWK